MQSRQVIERQGYYYENIDINRNLWQCFSHPERRRPDLNRWILVLQTIALPLGYVAVFSFLCWLRASEQGVADPRLTTWLCRRKYCKKLKF